jgi:D-3-phosphoglycerate dehydrogenase
MSRPSVFLTHSPSVLANYYGPRALAALEAVATVKLTRDEVPYTDMTLAAAAQGCDIIISDRRVAGGAELLASLPNLVAICRCAIDVRNIDVPAASAYGILVTQASAGFMASVSEWIIGMMVDLSRHISPTVAQYQAGIPPTLMMGRELRGSTLGIVGFGQIARYVADLALAFGMRVCVTDPFVLIDNCAIRQVSMDELLKQSDFVVCLATATPQTENLFGEAAFAAMQTSAYFINASRGNLVDEAALLRALDDGQIAGCALDVGRAPDQMPNPELARHPRLRATPHIGGLTPPAIEHQSLETAVQVAAIVRGQIPPGAVNAAHAKRLFARFPFQPGIAP